MSITTVQKHAINNNFQLTLNADIHILTNNTQFYITEPTLNLIPNLNNTKQLINLIKYSQTTKIYLTNQRIHTNKTLTINLTSTIIPHAELDNTITHTIQTLLIINHNTTTKTKTLLLTTSHQTQNKQKTTKQQTQYHQLHTLTNLKNKT